MNLEVISKYPAAGKAHSTPLLFVHGAWHGAWCWSEHYLDYFAQNGFAAHAVSLRGHGLSEGRQDLKWARVSDYVTDVANAAKQLPAAPVVIGHSMGGFIAQKYLENNFAPAAVLLASAPTKGMIPAAFRFGQRQPLACMKMLMTFDLYPLVATMQRAQEALFSDSMEIGKVLTYSQRLQSESMMAFLDMFLVNLPDPNKIKSPMLVLGAGQDAVFTRKETEETAQAFRTKAEFFEGMSHDIMLDPKWQESADRILSWLSGVLHP